MVRGISAREDVRDAVRRLAHRRLEPAVDALGLSSDVDFDEVVHDVRKRCKRVRALLRLVRDHLPDDVYRRENRTVRDAARQLSPVRDAAVLVRVHDEVVGAGAVPIPDFRTALVDDHERLRRQVLDDDTVPMLRQRLATVVGRIETWPVEEAEWDVLGVGLGRVYRRGRKAMAAALDEPTTEHFHEWRRRAKYLRLQLDLLKELWPEVIGGMAKSAHALTDVLGDEHDLAVLASALDGAAIHQEGQARLLAELIASRRALLQARARPIGLRLYAEKPSRFIARLGHYWEAERSATAA